MMRTLACVLTMIAAPLSAFERATADECATMWPPVLEQLPIGLITAGPEIVDAPIVTADGFCRLTGDAFAAALDGVVEAFDWRVDGIDRMLNEKRLPERLEVRITGIDAKDDPPEPQNMYFLLSHDQESRSLLVEKAVFARDDGNMLQFTAYLTNLDLSSPGATVMSLGGVSLGQMVGQYVIVGANDLLGMRSTDTGQQSTFWGSLDSLPDEILSVDDKAHLRAAVAQDGDDGTLDFSLQSERGIGFLQLVIGNWVEDPATPEQMNDAAALLLDGTQLRFNWTPATTIAQ